MLLRCSGIETTHAAACESGSGKGARKQTQQRLTGESDGGDGGDGDDHAQELEQRQVRATLL